MSIATITFKDAPNDMVDVRIEFGDFGINEESGAHHSAVQCLTLFNKANAASRQDEDEGWDG